VYTATVSAQLFKFGSIIVNLRTVWRDRVDKMQYRPTQPSIIEKRVVDFLLMLIKLFSLGVTGETLRAQIDRKSTHCKRVGQLPPNIRVEGNIPHQSFLHG